MDNPFGITGMSVIEGWVLVVGIICACIFFTTIVFKLIEDCEHLNRVFPRKEQK